jgi:hypothetical protein
MPYRGDSRLVHPAQVGLGFGANVMTFDPEPFQFFSSPSMETVKDM